MNKNKTCQFQFDGRFTINILVVIQVESGKTTFARNLGKLIFW